MFSGKLSKLTIRGLAARLGLLGLGLLLGLALAEAGLRLAGISYPLPYVPDPHCGSRLRPGMAARFMAEGNALVRINEDGLRDRPHTREKPPGVVRIAVLGDSFAEALQVPRETTFWAVLERELNRRQAFGDRTVEVLNFGVSGFGTAQELEMLRHYAWSYEPDVILLAFFTGNDLRDNSHRLSPDGVRPYYKPGPSGWDLDRSFREHPLYKDAQSPWSRFKVAWINRLRLLQLARYWRTHGGGQPAGPSASESGLDPIFAAPRDPVWREAWDVSEWLLRRMHEETQSHGADFWIVVLSRAIQVDPDSRRREALAESLGVDDLFYADRRIEQLGDREGFPVVLLAPRFQRHAEQHDVYLHGFPNTALGTGHWNAAGHRLAGEILADELAQAAHDSRPLDAPAGRP